jgi:cytochrome c oxidase subunit 2
MPGRLNDAWFRADKAGVYYGQCSELCGKDHAYMPIVIEVVSQADFDSFIIKSGGKTKALAAAEMAQDAAVAAVPAEAAATPAAAQSVATPDSKPVVSKPAVAVAASASSSPNAAPAAVAAQ